MELSVKKRKKIFLLFFLGIGLPSLLLGYFAFRGIQNDQALLEKGKLDDHLRAAEQVTSSINQSISEVEQAFLKALSSPDNSGKQDFIQLLKDFEDQYPLVEESFLFQNDNEIRFPSAEHLFFPDGSLTNSSISSRQSFLNQNFRKAQQLEFQQKNYQKALSFYLRTMEQVNDRQLKGECLSAIARVQKKAKLFEQAMESYKKISEDYSQVRITEGIPLGLAYRFELGLLHQETGDILSAIKTHTELFSSMINSEWPLEEAAYVFFSETIKSSIQDIFSQEPLPSEIFAFKKTYENLKNEELDRRKQTERLLLFQERAATDIQAKMPSSPGDSSTPSKRCIVEMGEISILYLCSIWIKERGVIIKRGGGFYSIPLIL